MLEAMGSKLVLTPERYDGKWLFGDTQVSGSVDLRVIDARSAG
jgi:hypothetical protein